MPDLHLAPFRLDATPPIGHPLCGGWIKPAEVIDDPLWLRGLVLLGDGPPIVLAALDWTGVLNESHRLWTEVIAEAARTTPDRVALHCVHQHNAPFVDLAGNDRLRKSGVEPLLQDDAFLDALRERSAQVVREATDRSIPWDRVAVGGAAVRQVACNRRVLGTNGKIRFTRTSSTTDPIARAEPEGTIDPVLRSVSFYRRDRPLIRLYYYTTHPMSYYGDGRVNADFVGLARTDRSAEEPGVHHIYFTGAAGNVTAGKYNDGAHENRRRLADRILAGMRVADRTAEEEGLRPVDGLRWTTLPHRFRPNEGLDFDRLAATAADPQARPVDRNIAAMRCAWMERLERGRPILLGRLDLGPTTVLHLPAETFVEYQLEAQRLRPDRAILTAAYGDGGPWYIPLQQSFGEGGYEPSVAFVAEGTEVSYRAAIAKLLTG